MSNRPTPAAFISYVQADNEAEGGRLIELCERLAREVRMLSGEEFPLFVDRKNINWGEAWMQRLERAIDASTFLIPIITPRYFKSKPCRAELERFAKREEELRQQGLLGSSQRLILPIYYVRTPLLENEDKRSKDDLAQLLASRQWADWRPLRHEDLDSREVRTQLTRFAEQICVGLEARGGDSMTIWTTKKGFGPADDFYGIEGDYVVRGQNDDGSTYRGRATIRARGETVTIASHIADEHYICQGRKVGDRLILEGDFDVEYSLQPDGSLVGTWGNGTKEVLTPIERS